MPKLTPKQEIDAINAKIVPLVKRRNEIEEREQRKTQIPRCKALVGACLRSTYGTAKDCYARILDLIEDKDGGYSFLLEEVSLINGVNPQMHLDNVSPYLNKEWWNNDIPMSGWERCEFMEYHVFKEKVLNEFISQKLMRKSMKNHSYKRN